MNEFETKINALRLQFKAEQSQITADSQRTIGHLNTAIGQVTTAEARETLRAEKQRVKEAMRNSHRWNRKCYLEKLNLLNEEYKLHLRANPSNRAIRRGEVIVF